MSKIWTRVMRIKTCSIKMANENNTLWWIFFRAWTSVNTPFRPHHRLWFAGGAKKEANAVILNSDTSDQRTPTCWSSSFYYQAIWCRQLWSTWKILPHLLTALFQSHLNPMLHIHGSIFRGWRIRIGCCRPFDQGVQCMFYIPIDRVSPLQNL